MREVVEVYERIRGMVIEEVTVYADGTTYINAIGGLEQGEDHGN